MQEKTIIKSEKQKLTLFYAIGIIGIVCFLIPFIYEMIHPGFPDESLIYNVMKSDGLHHFLWPIALVLIAFAVVFSLMYSKVELTVTDKRAYGYGAFGKRVDLPLDSISAVGTGAFHSIAITSASGAIKFGMIKNSDKIHSVISQLLIDRQGKSVAATTIKQEIPQSNADELKKYKDLLDSGVISQDEFDAKKKQLLGM